MREEVRAVWLSKLLRLFSAAAAVIGDDGWEVRQTGPSGRASPPQPQEFNCRCGRVQCCSESSARPAQRPVVTMTALHDISSAVIFFSFRPRLCTLSSLARPQ